ncbi:hypothetical protein COV05_01095 [Candidatus Uhrbacteria bacterium CG10_big_fil_rev_8_21_14_0_10_48_16]|uniref:N-acetyltransferase domain-containing protein n=1 Tax=Candidatus Uhrbacteria bacterium CG10_big_fil_rev_8_21_14_0_10_48_16 TaxID=1975038 RepID=A0A2M8LHT7_9BACT|nr:MAG: hypothetical protein COV05_01095 [Candidatus Uhrbacteria bacterium CG10_big_fil_rev_8_21_14_0_10_48_16]
MQTLTGTTHPTSPLEYDKDIDGAEKTPGIDYLHGEELDDFREEWYEAIEAMTRAEPHLLTKTREDLEPAVRERRIVVAIDRTHGDKVVGCIVLWPLCKEEDGLGWYELGTFLVIPSYRFGQTKLPIGDNMYRYLLATNREKNILGTTTNAHAIHTGMRHGMQMISFHTLPLVVHRATCICPFTKTGTNDNLRCHIKDGTIGQGGCRVRVSTPTWERMGKPPLFSF